MKRFSSVETKKFVSKANFDKEIILNKDLSWPKISIVTPSYNQGQFLERTILSVLNQNYPNLEYIIIDGGSSDESVEIIKKYEKYLAYWVSEQDNGQSDAINKGFSKSSGEILAYINSDDTYRPEAFLNVVETFQKNPSADLVFGNIYFINEYDRMVGELRLTKLDITHFVFEGISLAQQAAFWTKDIYNKVGGLNQQYQFCMDFDLFTRIADIGHLAHITEHLANFRIHKDSKTSTNLDIWRAEHNEIIRHYLPQRMSKVYLVYKKNLCRLRRVSHHIAQGDLKYILKKCVNRFCGVTFCDEIAMKNKIKKSIYKNEKNINTGYPESEAAIYDQRRFSDPKGKLFNKLEMCQLEHVLYTLPPRQRILEVGCGTGRFMVKCLEAGHEVHGLDPSPSMLTECRQKTSGFEKVYYYLGEGAKLLFKNNEFNFVYSIRTLNQVSSKSYALDMVREMIRVCCNDGIILLEFVNKWSFALRRRRSVRLSINDIKLVIKEYGNVEVKDISGILFFPQTLMNLTPALLLGMFEKVDILFSKMFPVFSTRCYVVLQKKS